MRDTTGATLRGFVQEHAADDAMVYTDGEAGYVGLPHHEAVRHSVGEYVRGQAHTNGMESFWSMLKRAYMGTFHKLSPKHLNRYVMEFAGRNNVRDLGTLAQMRDTLSRLVGRNLLYADLSRDAVDSLLHAEFFNVPGEIVLTAFQAVELRVEDLELLSRHPSFLHLRVYYAQWAGQASRCSAMPPLFEDRALKGTLVT